MGTRAFVVPKREIGVSSVFEGKTELTPIFLWVIVLVGYLGIRMPLTYLLTWLTAEGGLGLGLQGAWLAMFFDLTLRGILVAARFLNGGWKHARV